MRVIKRAAALALAALFLLTGTSCGFAVVSDLPPVETEAGGAADLADAAIRETLSYARFESAGQADAERYLDELPACDYGAAVFFVKTASKNGIAPDEAGTTLSRLNTERNAVVSDKLNITLVFSESASSSMLEEVKKSVKAGSFYADLLMFPLNMTGSYIAEKTLSDLRSLPSVDLAEPYFNSSSADAASAGAAVYAAAGDACLSPDDYAALFVNRALLREISPEDAGSLYGTVREGKWTYDRFLALNALLNRTNRDSGSRYHTVTTRNLSVRLPDLVFASSGGVFLDAGTDKTPAVGFTAGSAAGILETLKNLYTDKGAVLKGGTNAIPDFSAGNSVFLAECLGVLPDLRDSGTDWGVVPLPKGSEDGQYRTLLPEDQLLFGIPVNASSAETSAVTLAALNAASYGYIRDAYVDDALRHVLRDNDTADMLDLILTTAAVDPAYAYGQIYPAVKNATYGLIRAYAADRKLNEKADELIKKANEEFTKPKKETAADKTKK